MKAKRVLLLSLAILTAASSFGCGIEGSKSDEKSSKSEITTEATTEAEQYDYVLNTNTHKFHYPSCKSVNQMKDKNKKEFHGTREEVIQQGYEPCKNCNP